MYNKSDQSDTAFWLSPFLGWTLDFSKGTKSNAEITMSFEIHFININLASYTNVVFYYHKRMQKYDLIKIWIPVRIQTL